MKSSQYPEVSDQQKLKAPARVPVPQTLKKKYPLMIARSLNQTPAVA
jgi:hypothetical protein